MGAKKFWSNWKTTAPALTIILVWAAKYFAGCPIPGEVAAAITGVLVSLGLLFAADA